MTYILKNVTFVTMKSRFSTLNLKEGKSMKFIIKSMELTYHSGVYKLSA